MSKIKVDISFAESVIAEEGHAVLGLQELLRQPAFEQVVQVFLECSGSVIVSGMGKESKCSRTVLSSVKYSAPLSVIQSVLLCSIYFHTNVFYFHLTIMTIRDIQKRSRKVQL